MHACQEWLLIDSQVSSNEVLSIICAEMVNVYDSVYKSEDCGLLARFPVQSSSACLHCVVVSWPSHVTSLEGRQGLEISVFLWQGLTQAQSKY
jgi:hypothetical protein